MRKMGMGQQVLSRLGWESWGMAFGVSPSNRSLSHQMHPAIPA